MDNVLFNRFPDDRQVIDPVRNRLAVVAYGMHTGEGLGEVRATPQAEATYAEIDRMLQTYQDHSPWTEPSYTGAVAAREQLLAHTGLFLPRGEQRAGFYHLTFQDFLAAQRLLDLHGDDLLNEFCQRAAVPEWRSTLAFVFASQLAKHASPQRSIVLLGDVVKSLTAETLGLAVVAADGLHLLLKRGLRLKPKLEETFRQYCLSAIARQVPLREREELGLALGHVGDPRIEPQSKDYWVLIPAGRFLMGAQKQDPGKPNFDQDAFGDEMPVHDVHVDAFRIARYPVTVAQYRQFIERQGYGDPRWWQAGGFREFSVPEGWEGQLQYPARPVVGVSWWEASAYCEWAGYRLPTEAEWERAARGTQARKYPWGQETAEPSRLNFSDSEINHPTPVGLYPSGATPEGIYDLAGNVWEWCADCFGEYSAESVSNPRGPDGATARVIRGGSWGINARDCRAAGRYRIVPQYRYGALGFRVAAVPPGG